MSGADLWEDNYPHGTPEGYDGGCKGGACPAGVRYGLSCKIAKSKSNGDMQYRRLAKAGESVPAIADALGLIGSEPSAAVAKKSPAPTAAPQPKPKPSISDLADPTDTSEKYIATEGSPQAKGVWEQTAEILGAATPPPAADAEQAPAAAAPSKPAPAPKSGEIRAWAREKGYDVAATGKLPKYIVDHYWDATGRLTLTDAIAKNLAANKPQDPTPAAEDTDSAETDTTAPAADTIEPAPADPSAPDNSTPTPDEQPEAERPDWGSVAAHVDVEAARNLAVRLEQELARSEEQRTADKAQHASSLRAADDVIGGVLEALGKGPDHDPILAASAAIEEATQLAGDFMAEFAKRLELEERLTRRTAERDDAEKRARIAEKAVELALTKWGEERAAIEASTALIHEQARTINTLSSYLAPQSWVLGEAAPDIDATAFTRSLGYTGCMVEIPRGEVRKDGQPVHEAPNHVSADEETDKPAADPDEEIVLGFDPAAPDQIAIAIAKTPRPWHRR